MDIIYNNSPISGQFLTPKETQNKPIVSLKGLDTNKYYSLIMFDPDAVGGNYIHWALINIHGNNFNTGNEILKYYGPHPPKDSGIHNYIFSLYESNQNSTNKLNQIKRQMDLNTLLFELGVIGEPIYTKKFISEYRVGGKTKRQITKNKRRITKRRTKQSRSRRKTNKQRIKENN